MSPKVFLVTGVDPAAMTATVLGLLMDQPRAVVSSHTLDTRHRLVRTVSDLEHVIESRIVELDHGCPSCAIREDVVPTLLRLVNDGRWQTVIAALPSGADAMQICRVIAAHPHLSERVEIAAVIACLEAATCGVDLTQGQLMRERGVGVYPDDDRGVAEVLGGLVEHADVVALVGESVPRAHLGLGRDLARPDAAVVSDWSGYDSRSLRCGVHDHRAIEAWVADLPAQRTLPPPPGVWRLILDSTRPLHPDRLYEHIEALGTGSFRTRGAFWVPTRPETLCQWDGAGGQLSIGAVGRWSPDEGPRSRLLMTGLLEDGDPRPRLMAAFREVLVSDRELSERGCAWEVISDGLEPWLGAVAHVRPGKEQS